MYDVNKVRQDFPILQRTVHGKPLAYLDNAATTQKPRAVLDAMRSFYETTNANVHRAAYTLSHEATLAWEDAHRATASFVGARGLEEVVFVRNATEALNLVAYAWGLHNVKKGDEIVVSILEHHANLLPWQFLEQFNGAVLKFVDMGDDGTLSPDSVAAAVTKKTRVVAMTHCSNVLGTITPVKEFAKIAHEAGAVFVCDAAQSVPHLAVNVRDLDVDFLAFSGHKMLAPNGSGALVAKKELLQGMEPFLRGGEMIKSVSAHSAVWNDVPWKFEAGTPDVAGGIGLAAAIRYLQKLGMDDVRRHEVELVSYALEKLKGVPGLQLYGPAAERRSGVVSFSLEGVHPHDIATLLDEQGVAIRSGLLCAEPLVRRLGLDSINRASFSVYSTKDEIDALAAGLENVRKVFA